MDFLKFLSFIVLLLSAGMYAYTNGFLELPGIVLLTSAGVYVLR